MAFFAFGHITVDDEGALAFVDEKTEGKIKEVVGNFDSLTRLVLTTAIYFKGDWANRFDEAFTRDAPFWITPEESVLVPLMFQDQRLRYGEAAGLQLLELPYVGADLSMILLLPREVDGLRNLEHALTAENLDKWLNDLNEGTVRVLLPSFKVESEFDLNQALQAMGMIDAFDEHRANFAGMDGRADWLYLSKVSHKACVEVNEAGTTAAAATAGVFEFRSAPPEFRADHPFVFLIRENNTGNILFLGRVVNPVVGPA